MVKVHFTSNLRRHVDSPSMDCAGETVRAVLDFVFSNNERLRHYVLDDQGALRKHMSILVNGVAVKDRQFQSDAIAADAEIWVMQALSGG
jgi:sulfur-carrier protein